MGDVITSSPSFISAAKQAACKAAVPLETATAYFAPTYQATIFSNSTILGPVVR